MTERATTGLLEEIETGETRLDEAVAAAREAGQYWQAIGDTVGLTRQGALKRYRNTAA